MSSPAKQGGFDMEKVMDRPEKVASPQKELRIADRCDRCNAQAFIIAVPSDKNLSDLLFCGHHGRAHGPALIAQGFDLIDYTDRINQKPTDATEL